MATLVSPGVAVSVIDESAYASGGQGTVPLIILATAQDKKVPSGASIASKTTQATARYPVLLTSQRELAQLFGAPTFKSLNGTPQHGNELNEYGLLAAHSYLGLANRAYVVRADIDLAALESRPDTPVGPAKDGQYWLDTASTIWGIFERVATAPAVLDWVEQPVTEVAVLDNMTAPANSFGIDGEYAVMTFPFENKYFKKVNGTWAELNSTSLGKQVYVQEHYDYPSTAAEGSVWLKTTTPNKGLSIIVKKYSASAGQWVSIPVSAHKTDTAASAAYGTELTTGALYARVTANVATFTLYRYNDIQWEVLTYGASRTELTGETPDKALWFNSNLIADIYTKTTLNGVPSWVPVSPSKVTIDTEAPATALVGSIWVDTNDAENYPIIKMYNGSKWVLRDTADQTTPKGVVFADLTGTNNDASASGAATPWSKSETPDPAVYPNGILLWNSMVSTYNVKQFKAETMLWHTISGNYPSGPKAGAMYSGRKAVRQVIVKAMQSAVTLSDKLREETVKFTLIAAPGYPELADEMLTLNVDRKETGFVIIDTPLRLCPCPQDIIDWVKGTYAGTNGEDGLVTKTYEAAVYYPSVLTTNLDGSDVVVPASHAVLRTMAYSDNVSYPWFAPAGLTRGVVTNATNFGYVTAEGEFQPVGLNNGQRDVLYANSINPLVNFPGQGLVVWGQKTLSPISSALDRVNVARLVAYLRERFDPIARPFIFEPNDVTTRTNIKAMLDRFLGDIMQKRGVYDFVVVCDTTNNTPQRIDANELWVDVAIEPVKAAEMIYIPLRLVNTNSLS